MIFFRLRHLCCAHVFVGRKLPPHCPLCPLLPCCVVLCAVDYIAVIQFRYLEGSSSVEPSRVRVESPEVPGHEEKSSRNLHGPRQPRAEDGPVIEIRRRRLVPAYAGEIEGVCRVGLLESWSFVFIFAFKTARVLQIRWCLDTMRLETSISC